MDNKNLKTTVLFTTVLLVLALIGGGVAFAFSQQDGKANGSHAKMSHDEMSHDEISYHEISYGEMLNNEPGILIMAVVPDSPAAKAGLVRGDILLALADREVNAIPNLLEDLDSFNEGEQVALTVLHGDEEKTLTVTLGTKNKRPYLGIIPCGGNAAYMPQGKYELHKSHGVMLDKHHGKLSGSVKEVFANSAAEEAGLQVGDVIWAVDGEALKGEHDLAKTIAAYQPGDTITLKIQSGSEEAREVQVTLGEHPDKANAAFLGVGYALEVEVEMMEGESGYSMFREHHGESMPFGEHHLMMLPTDVKQGSLISYVYPDSPAATAKLNKGDIITAIDGTVIAAYDDVQATIATKTPGDTVTLSIASVKIEKGVETEDTETIRQVDITLAANPKQADKAYLGLKVGGFLEQSEPGHFRFLLKENHGSKDFMIDKNVVINKDFSFDHNGHEGMHGDKDLNKDLNIEKEMKIIIDGEMHGDGI